jgi:hypothetical protein
VTVNNDFQQARPRLEAIGNKLHEISEGLHDRSVEELGTGRPVNANVAEAIRAIESVRAELLEITGHDSGQAADVSLERERTQRAVSEVRSEEFDSQA